MTTNYQKQRKAPKKKTCKRYQNLSEEEKDKRQKKKKKARERYPNVTEEEKEKKNLIQIFVSNNKNLAEYRRNYYLTHKK